MCTRLLALLALILLVSNSYATSDVCLVASRGGGVDHIAIEHIYRVAGEGEVGIVVLRNFLGLCDAEEIVSPEVFDFPENLGEYPENFYNFDVPIINEAAHCSYYALVLMADGSMVEPGGAGQSNMCWSGASINSLEAPVGRGVCSFSFGQDEYGRWLVTVTGCGDCWYSGQDYIPFDSIEEAMSMTGQVVDIYGTNSMGMHGWVFNLDRIEVSPNGCGPVPNKPTSWSSLKATYR